MTDQRKTRKEQALAILEEAWSYYTPQPRPAADSPAYEEYLLAA